MAALLLITAQHAAAQPTTGGVSADFSTLESRDGSGDGSGDSQAATARHITPRATSLKPPSEITGDPNAPAGWGAFLSQQLVPSSPTAASSETASTGGTGDSLGFGISLQGDNLDTTFFARERFGFDLDTPGHVAEDVGVLGARAADALGRLRARSPGVTAALLTPWVISALLILFAAWQDRRLRRWAARRAAALEPLTSSERPAVTELRRTIVRSAAVLALPIALWLASYVPIQGMFESAPWTQALSDCLLLLVFYRVFARLTLEIFSGAWFDVPDEVGKRIRRTAVSSLRLILVFMTATLFLERVGYREDVVALARTALRLSVMLLSFRLYGLRAPVLSLFPAEGSAQYRRIVGVLSRYSGYVLGFSTFLLALWFLGFRRAASTILLRSWAIIGLSVGAALFLRWFDRRVESLPEGDDSLFAAIVERVDSFARFCAMTAFALAITRFLGLYELLFALLDAIRITIGDTPITLFNILRAGVVLAVAVLLSRVVRTLLEHTVYPWLDLDSGAAHALSTSVHYALIALAIGLALVTVGLDLRALTVFAGALGVGIGFGLQDMARNLMSGFVLLFGRSVRRDDLITVNDRYDGYVRKIGARAVTIVTRDNYELVVPASDLVNSTIINWTHNDPDVRLRIPVGVSYKSDPNVVRDALLDAADRYAERYPRTVGRGRHADGRLRRPDVLLVGFGDSALDFELVLWIDGTVCTPDEARGRVYFELWDALKERSIEIPFPQRDLHLSSVAPSARDALRGASDAGDTDAS